MIVYTYYMIIKTLCIKAFLLGGVILSTGCASTTAQFAHVNAKNFNQPSFNTVDAIGQMSRIQLYQSYRPQPIIRY